MQLFACAQFTFLRNYYKRDTSKGLLAETLISNFVLLFQKLLQLISYKTDRPNIVTLDDRVLWLTF